MRFDNPIAHIYRIERARRRLMTDTGVIESSKYLPRPEYAGEYTVGEFAADTSALWKCLILYRLARRASRVLELGTGLGISTAYLAAGARHLVCSVEADQMRSDIARGVIGEVGLSHCTMILTDTFDSVIGGLKRANAASFNLVYVDGDHEGDALIRYYESVLPLIYQGAIVVIDDLLWSRDMRLAWKAIQNRSEVYHSRKVHDLGILWTDTEAL